MTKDERGENAFDPSLINRLTILADKERKVNEYKKRWRIKGNIIAKGETKKGNITLSIKKGEVEHKFTILKSHKERYALAKKLSVGRSVYAEGIHELRIVICTRLKTLEKGIRDDKQTRLEEYA